MVGAVTEEDDELDKLLNSYEHQAQSDLAAVQAATSKKPKHVTKSMNTRREEGLATPLAPETKCELALLSYFCAHII